jgi:UDPglucose--hexose-1-phosphate uridylyltransferase
MPGSSGWWHKYGGPGQDGALMSARVTTSQLADGREILYYDDPSTPDRGRALVPDARDLPRTEVRSEVRYDAARDQDVVLAAHRQTRTFLPPTDECPLCPSREGRLTEVPAPDYDVVVFENRFPSLAVGATLPEGIGAADGLFARRAGIGRCEVVCFTADHDTGFAGLTAERAGTVLQAWTERTAALGALPGVEQVFCFENRGREIGVTLAHPHGQIYAYPYVTPRTAQMLAAAARHRERTGGLLLDDLLAAEQRDGSRVVLRSTHWTAFVPYAARWPFEVHLHPHRTMPDLCSLDDDERTDFAAVYLDVLRRFDALFGAPMPYISAWHQAPVRQGRDLTRLHLQLFSVRRAADKLKYLAGSESAMDAFINDVRPEDAAAQLREARP